MGANTMGVYNIENNTLIGGFDTRAHPKGGNVALISQSGAGMSGIGQNRRAKGLGSHGS